MNSLSKIGTIEAIAFILILLINQIIINVPKEIIHTTANGAWLNVIIISIIAILFTLLICRLFKNFAVCDLIDISEYVGGKWLKNIVGIIYFAMFIFITAIVLRNFVEVIKAVIFPLSPITFILLFFIIGIVISNKTGFSSIAKINLVITIVSLLAILVIFFFPMDSYVIDNLFPVLGYGFNETFISGLTNLFSFNGIIFLFFLPPLLKDPSKFKRISIISVTMASFYLFLSVVSLLLLFSFIIESEELLSILLISRIVQIGSFIKRVDAIFLFIWILSFVSYLSITTFFALHVFKKATNIQDSNGIVYCLGAIIFGIALLPARFISSSYFEMPVTKYSILIITFLVPTVLLIWANLKFKRKNKLTLKKE